MPLKFSDPEEVVTIWSSTVMLVMSEKSSVVRFVRFRVPVCRTPTVPWSPGLMTWAPLPAVTLSTVRVPPSVPPFSVTAPVAEPVPFRCPLFIVIRPEPRADPEAFERVRVPLARVVPPP